MFTSHVFSVVLIYSVVKEELRANDWKGNAEKLPERRCQIRTQDALLDFADELALRC